MTWTDDQVVQLRNLAAANRSAREIGLMMGFTKNAIIGKMDRLGIESNRPVKKNNRPANDKFPSDADRMQVLRAESFNAPTETSKSLFDLKQNECRWPVAEKLFCGEASEEGKPYCACHTKRAKSG